MIWAFSTGYEGFWRPLLWLSYMLDVTLFGMGPGGFHFTNLLLHAVNAVLVFLLFRRLTGAHWPSAIVAALFAWHPLRVESVAWVTERKDTLSTFFGLLALWAYSRYAQCVTGDRWQVTRKKKSRRRDCPVTCHVSRFYGLALLFFALGLMSKPMLVTLAFAMLLLDYWPLNRLKPSNLGAQLPAFRRLLVEKVPFFALAAIFSMSTLLLQKHIESVRSLADFPVASRMGNAVMSYVQYLGKTFWPVNLAVFYPPPGHRPWAVVMLAARLLMALSVAAVWIGRKHPFVFTGWFWFAGTLVPVIGLVQTGNQVMADRFTYVPLIGIFIIISWGAAEVFARWKFPKMVIAIMAGLVLTACAFRTRDQLGYWQNGGTVFRHAIAVTQNNYTACYNLGIYLANRGLANEAVDNYHAAIRIDPNRMDPHLNLGIVLEKAGQLNEAAKEYREAVRLDPNSSAAHFNLGCVLGTLGQRNEAIEQFRETLRLKPGFKVAELRLQELGVSPSR